MANPTPLTHTTVLGRKTLQNILDFVAFLCGLSAADFPVGSTERAILFEIINDEAEEWRILAPVKGYGEMVKDYEWAGGGGDDPASGDTQVKLPLDFAEFKSGSELYELDSDGNVTEIVHVVSYHAWNTTTVQGQSPYEHIEGNIAIIHRIDSINKRRILEIYPAPADGYKLRVPYFSHVEKLVNLADELEAPVSIQRGIAYGTAVGFLMTGRGASEKLDEYKDEKKRLVKLWRSPEAREVKRTRRVRAFTEHGYAVFEPPSAQDFPVIRQNLD